MTRFMAADVLSDHFAVVGGNVASQDVNKRWCRENNIDRNSALKRWAWAKMGARFNKCDRNPVSACNPSMIPHVLYKIFIFDVYPVPTEGPVAVECRCCIVREFRYAKHREAPFEPG